VTAFAPEQAPETSLAPLGPGASLASGVESVSCSLAVHAIASKPASKVADRAMPTGVIEQCFGRAKDSGGSA
jgi:hypothetical protein